MSETTTNDASAGPERLTRSERLDRLPFTRAHGKLLAGSGIGWALDAMDVGMISFVMAALAKNPPAGWNLSPVPMPWGGAIDMLSVIGSIGFIGMALGATLGGLLADKLGRRQVFALTLLIYGLATGASALSVSVGMLIALRFLVGLGLGAELPVASTLVSEFAPRKIRGRMVVALEAFWALGWILAALVGYFMIPNIHEGWRWALALGVIPTIYAAVVRYGLPESVRFLEKQDREEEAEAAVRRFEESAGVAPVPSPDSPPASQEKPAPSLWSKELRGRTLGLWIVWFCINFSYYGAFIWLPTLLVHQGFPLVKSFEYTLIITLAQLPGYAVAAWLIEVWGRRSTLAVFLLGSAVAAGLFGQAASVPMIIAAGCALSFFNLGAWGALYAIGPELYPTAARGKGTGAAAAFGRIASMIAPFSVPPLIAVGGGNWLVFSVFAAAFLIAAVAAFVLPEQRDAALAE